MEQLKRVRATRGLSQAKLAAKAGLDPSTVNQIERGAREASPATLRKLAEALDVSLAELLEDESPKAQAPLPFEEGQRRDLFFDALTSYMKQRARAWEQELADNGDTLLGEPEYVFDALLRNEQVQTEATMMLSAVFKAVLGDPPSQRSQAELTAVLGEPHELTRKELVGALLAVMRASREWSERTDGAWAGATDMVEASKLARVRERAEEAIRDRENVVAMFPMRDIA